MLGQHLVKHPCAVNFAGKSRLHVLPSAFTEAAHTRHSGGMDHAVDAHAADVDRLRGQLETDDATALTIFAGTSATRRTTTSGGSRRSAWPNRSSRSARRWPRWKARAGPNCRRCAGKRSR